MIPNKIKIFIADDHEMILPGLKMVIESREGFFVTGHATDGLTAFNMIMKLNPDIVIADLSIPVLNGFEITRKLKEKYSPARIIILTSFSDDKYIHEALELKVDGYILKENSSAELIHAIEEVAAGNKYMSAKVITKIVNGLEGDTDKSGRMISTSVTQKELEVLKLIAEGKRGREISNILDISESTLKTHKASLMKKLHADSTNELIVYALKNLFTGDR